jgi:hypothetical protein
MTNSDDKVFKELADRYVEIDGQFLLQEQRALEEQRISYPTPRSDAQIRLLVGGHKKSKKAPILAIAAALLVAFIGASAVFLQYGEQLFPSLTPSQNAPADGDVTDVIPGDSGGATPDGQGTSSDGLSDSPGAAQLHPINFELPAQFSVADSKLDNGETIYHLDNSKNDDVVMTIKDAGAKTSSEQTGNLDEVYIDGTVVTAKLRDEFKLLTFESDGAIYTISCRDDIGTLSNLYRSITA